MIVPRNRKKWNVVILACLGLCRAVQCFVMRSGVGATQTTGAVGKRHHHHRPLSVSLPKDELIRLTKDYLENPSPDKWSEDFVFRGPVIGPLVKKDIINTLGAVAKDLQVAFPDYELNAFGFTADDPIEPNRVWYFVRPRGTFLGPFNHPVVGTIEPTGAKYVAPPEVRSVLYNDEGLIQLQTVGYVVDRFTGDTTGGRGAVFGQYAVMGQAIDATVGSPATILLQKLSQLLPDGMIPLSYSKKENIPSWWTDPRRGAEA
jgi:hypothetical protein